jgi:ATPase involved in DNA replication initiation
MTVSKSFVDALADSICAQYPSGALETSLAVVSAVAVRQRMAAVRDFSRGRVVRCQTRKDQVLDAVCQRFGVTSEELRSPCRKKRFSAARAVACSLMRSELQMSSSDVGVEIGRDHTTVLSNTARVRDDSVLAEHANELARALRAQWDVVQVEAAE